MATSNASNFANWQRAWDTRNAVAGDFGIPQTAVKAVASQDYNRLLTGANPMSNQDAYAAMQSVAQHKVQTADPSSPAQGNIATNTFKDAQAIFTGIFHIPQTLAADVKGVAQGFADVSEGKGWKSLEQAGNNVAQLLPGVTDVEQALKGNFGYFKQHPLFSLLDLAGTTRIAQAAADFATGAEASANIAFKASEEAAQRDGFVTPSPSIRPVPTLSDPEKKMTLQAMILSRHPYRELTQRGLAASPGATKFLDKNLGKLGYFGKRIDQIIRPINIQRQLGQEEMNNIARDIYEVGKDLTPDETNEFTALITTPHLPEDILGDPNISQVVKNAYSGYKNLVDVYNLRAIKRGLNVEIHNPSTGQIAIVPTGSQGATLLRQFDTFTAKHEVSQNKVIAAQEKFLTHSRIVQDPVFNAPIGMEAQFAGKQLTATQFFASARVNLLQKGIDNLLRITPDTSSSAARQAADRLTELLAEDGPIDKLAKAIANPPKDPAARAYVKNLLGRADRSLRSKYFSHVPQIKQLKDTLDQYRYSLGQIHNQRLTNAIKIAQKNEKAAAKKVVDKANEIAKKWPKIASDKYEEVITQIMKGELGKLYKTLPMERNQLEDVLRLLEAGDLYPTGIRPFVSDKQLKAIQRDAIQSYDKLIQKGAVVLWVPKVKEGTSAGVVRVGATHIPSLPGAKSRALNSSYFIQNPFFGLTKRYEEIISYERSDAAFEMGVKQRLVPQITLQKQAEDEWLNLRATNPSRAPKSWQEYFHIMYKDWSLFDYHTYLPPNSRHIKLGQDQVPMMIHTNDLELMRKMNEFIDNPITRVWDKSLGVFRNAVLTISPRFFAHITLGGTFLMLGITDPTIFRFIPEAFQMIKDGKFPAGLSHGTGFEGKELSEKMYAPEQWHQWHAVLSGRTSGRLYIESVAKRLHLDIATQKTEATAHAYRMFLEHISDMQRSLSFLYGKAKAERRLTRHGDVGLTEEELQDAKNYHLTPQEYAGVKLANKVLADNNTRTPLERTLIRFMFPFGGWTKHILRYVFNFPADHPLRANFLANLAEQSFEDDKSGMPQYLFHLLYLGHPDPNGNVTAIDFRQWNPLRDVANYFTLGGFVSQLNPAVEGILSSMGINTISGSPELYPQLSYDSFFGSMQVQQPTGNTPLNMLQSYIPEFGVLDHFLKLSNYNRSLARFDPAAYKQQLWTSLNFPWMPQHININQIISKQETDRLNEMKSLVTTALQTNDYSRLNNLPGPFPYQGWYFSRGQIKQIIAAAEQWSKQTGVPVPASEILTIPTAPSISPIAEQITPPVTLTAPQLASQVSGGPGG